MEKCRKTFSDKENLKLHEKTEHECEKNNKFACAHAECSIKFKTKKQKLIHHNKIEEECKNERSMLIQLIMSYKTHADSLTSKYSEREEFNSPLFNEIKENIEICYKDLEFKLLDPDYFYCLLGRKRSQS